MLESLKDLFAELTGGAKHAERFADNDYRVAAAALLVHAATIDGNMKQAERDKLHTVLKEGFSLDEAATEALIDEGERAEHDAVDLYHFTNLISHSMDEAGRARVVEMLWQIVYADGRVNEFEDNLVWRAADLLGVSSRERIEIKRRVAGEKAEAEEPG
jgi:uncharacterized tellurite resistance protein B-like protein